MKKRMCVLLACVGLLLSACDNPSVVTETSSTLQSEEIQTGDGYKSCNVRIEQAFYWGNDEQGKTLEPEWDQCYHITPFDWENMGNACRFCVVNRPYVPESELYPQDLLSYLSIVLVDGRLPGGPEENVIPSRDRKKMLREAELFELEDAESFNFEFYHANDWRLRSDEASRISIVTLAGGREIPAASAYASVDYSNTVSFSVKLREGVEEGELEPTPEEAGDVSTDFVLQPREGATRSWIGTDGSSLEEYRYDSLQEKLYFFGVADEPGAYTTMIFVDGKASPVFGGKTYLDWEMGNRYQSQRVFAPIDESVIPDDGKEHVVFALTINRTKSEKEDSSNAVQTSRTAVVSRR